MVIHIPNDASVSLITGSNDDLLHLLDDAFETKITFRGDEISLNGDENEVKILASIFSELIKCATQDNVMKPSELTRLIDMSKTDAMSPGSLRDDVVLTYKGKVVRPRTSGQKVYLESIRNHKITFCLGPAGTGKTYLAMAMAINAYKAKEVSRIVLTRPIVEAGENLGFLPGTLTEKVDPYIQPLYDALFSMMDAEKVNHLLDIGTIEICPLAFMRGRTLSDAFIILDEAQNATAEQIKMFLTRLGESSKMVITGDLTQSDLAMGPKGVMSARKILDGIEDISFIDLSSKDVVRNSLVSTIIAAYEKAAK